MDGLTESEREFIDLIKNLDKYGINSEYGGPLEFILDPEIYGKLGDNHNGKGEQNPAASV